jgi:hypothetical protein
MEGSRNCGPYKATRMVNIYSVNSSDMMVSVLNGASKLHNIITVIVL